MARPLSGSSLLLLLLCVLAFASANLIQFGVMIRGLTGRNGLDYNGYGCHCGWGGSGQPVDDTDWCCHVHDCCYEAVSLRKCHPKLVTYFYSSGKNTITCLGGNECQRQTCECDKAAALCFRRSTYRDQYYGYAANKCQGASPPCANTKRG
uniref:Phospholipase A2 type IIE n=1 Tax=Dispholidus typus TaxID=46295 RepID=I0BWR8_DISTY|nr:phospholipase A2 type IIE [Dispholidus typus]